MPNSETIEMVYAADGQRVSRTNGDYSTVYVGGLLEVDSDSSGVTDSRTFYSVGGRSVGVESHTADETTFSFDDHLGSVVATFNDDTDMLAVSRYHPWGTERMISGSLPADRRFTNQVADNTDAQSGGSSLLFYASRYLDPSLGVFVAPDTTMSAPDSVAGLNRYAYVGQNPVNRVDPTGRCWWVPFSGDSGCPLAQTARDVWSDLTAAGQWTWDHGGEWIWDHRSQIAVTVAAAICVAATAGSASAPCSGAAWAAFAVQESEVIANADSWEELLLGTVWAGATSYVLYWPSGAGALTLTEGFTAGAIAESATAASVLTALGEVVPVVCAWVDRCRQGPAVIVDMAAAGIGTPDHDAFATDVLARWVKSQNPLQSRLVLA